MLKEFSSSSVEDEASAIAAQPMNAAAPAKSAQRPFGPREKGIMIKEQPPQEQQKQPEAEASDKDEDPEIIKKGKKPVKKALAQPSEELLPSSVRKALLEAAENRIRTEAWLQRQKDKAAGVGASTRGTRSSFTSLEVDQQYVVIEDVNPSSEMRRVMLPFEGAERRID